MPGSDSGKKQQQRERDAAQMEADEAELQLAMGEDDDDDEDYALGQEQVIQTILALGNEIWRNFGQEEEITDYAVFFQHQFYIECFQMAYPSYDFSDLVKATDEAESAEQMAACIQALINLLAEEILVYDMNHIRGDEIVHGNAEHCINLLQILQQISSASMMQEASGDGSEQRSESQRVLGQGDAAHEGDRPQSSPDKLPRSASAGDSGNAPKSRAATGEKDPMFDGAMDDMADLDGVDANPAFMDSGPDKHQFLDNLDEEIGMNDDEDDGQDYDQVAQPSQAVRARPGDRNANSKLGADKVGDVIGQELDVEFEPDIQDNLQNHQGRGSAGSAGSSEQQTAQQMAQNQKQQILDGEQPEFDENGDMVDHNQVNIIDDEQDFLDGQQDPRGSDQEMRNLQNHPDNMANLQRQMQRANDPNQMNDYDGELDDQDEDGLDGLQDGQYDQQNQQLILDDQNLDMDNMHELDPRKANQRQVRQEMGDDEDQDGDEVLDLDDIDPALLEAAVQQLAMAPDGYQVPESELMQHHSDGEQQQEGESPITDPDDPEEDQGLAEILDGVNGDGQHSDEGVGKHILRGGQNIEDDQQIDGDDEDDLPDVEVREMSEKLKLLNAQDLDPEGQHALQQMRQQIEDDEDELEDDDQGQDGFGDDDEPMIDTDNLDDKEKALLCRYLQAEYEKDPESLPMPREVVEEFLARNQDLLEQLDDLEDDGQGQIEMQARGPSESHGEAGVESLNNGIDSNEIVVEGQQDDEEKGSEDEEGLQDQNDDGDIDDQLDEQAQRDDQVVGESVQELVGDAQVQYLDQEELEAQQRMQVGEMNIEGGEHNIDEEENMMVAAGYVPNGAEYVVQQHQGQPEDDGAAGQGYGEEDDVGEDDDEQNPHQMFNPQYELDEIQEVEQDDGNGYLFQNINLQGQQPGNFTQEQLNFMQQQQISIDQMQLQQYGLPRKSAGKRKKVASAYARKPPVMGHGAAFQRGSAAGLVGRAPVSAAAKKAKRAKPGGNTISHDDEHQSLGGRQMAGLDMGNFGANRSRRPNSHKRPQTAKTRKPIGLGIKAKQRQNQFFGAPPSASLKAAVTSSTPSNRMRSGKMLGAGPAGSLKNMIVPQQSQMFTSFGVPHGAMQSISQRKAASNPKKRYQGLYGSVKGAAPPTRKKSRATNQTSVPRLARNAKKNQQYQGNVPGQAQVQQQLTNQPMPTTAADQAQNLVEMPILSEEFLNQLNEEQLQALLEQQQQLMMLQQQNQVQPAGSTVDGQQSDEKDLQFQNQIPEDGQLFQQQQMSSIQQQNSQTGLRNRGRSKAYAQEGGRQMAARIPSGSRKGTIPASAGGPRASSGSRSAHGSRKRTQKTRSSLNVASSGPLSLGPPIAGLGPITGGASSNSVFRSQKMAAQIYGNSADTMLNNLISQRKKSGKGAKKRSQPNQAGKALAHQLNQMQQSSEPYDIQAQLLAQQAQYNKLLAQQQPGATADQLAANQLPPGYSQGMQQEGPEGIITEVSPEQEEGESQSQFNQLSQQQKQQLIMQMQQQQMVGGGQSNIQPMQGQISNIADDLSTEQIIELLQNAADAQNSQNNGELDGEGNFDENGAPISQNLGQQLPEEIQVQLQQVLQERMLQQQQQQFLLQQQQMLNPGRQQAGRPAPVTEAIAGMALNDRVQSYQNICNILTESVQKARKKHGHLTDQIRAGQSSSSSPQRSAAKRMGALTSGGRDSLDADQRILKQKKQFENLLRQYRMDLKLQETKRQQDLRRAEKIALREEKIQQMKQKKFEEGMITQQRSQIIKRNAQQARLAKKVFKLASELEKDKLLDEKKQLKEHEQQKVSQRRAMVQTIENYYKDKIDMLKDRIDQEKFERQVAQEAQKKAFSQMKKELGDQKRKEVERYIQLLQQEDDKFDMSNLNASRLEHEVVRLYKKKQ